MVVRAAAIWFAILIAAICNGYVRQAWIIPRTGELGGHIISTVTLSLVVLIVAWASIGWVAPATTRDAWVIGALWLVSTLAFEFLAGHFLFGQPWSRLLADYDVVNGRIWVLVLIVTATAPFVAAQVRGLLPSAP